MREGLEGADSLALSSIFEFIACFGYNFLHFSLPSLPPSLPPSLRSWPGTVRWPCGRALTTGATTLLLLLTH